MCVFYNLHKLTTQPKEAAEAQPLNNSTSHLIDFNDVIVPFLEFSGILFGRCRQHHFKVGYVRARVVFTANDVIDPLRFTFMASVHATFYFVSR